MAHRFVFTDGEIGYERKYYRFPVEVWRGLLDNPQEVFDRCVCLMCADVDTLNELSAAYGCDITGSNARKLAAEHKAKGNAFLDKLGMAGNTGSVYFTIKKDMFWEYRRESAAGNVKEWELLLLLWWMALHTIDGRRRGATAVHNTTNGDVFRRAAGFSTWGDFKLFKWRGDEAMCKYIADPSRMARYSARLRDDLMMKYDTFHAYSQKGKRGWCFMLSEIDRQRAFELMVAHMATRRTPKQQFKNDIADMKAKARARVANGELTI